MVLFTFLSLPLIFTFVAASISHFLTAAKQFSCYSSNEIGLLCFPVSCSSSFSVIYANVDFKIKSKQRIGFVVVVFFISKSPGGYAIYCRNARVLEMQNFTPAYMKGWTYVRTYSVRTIFSEPVFLGCIVYQIFLPKVIRCARFARESSATMRRSFLSYRPMTKFVLLTRQHDREFVMFGFNPLYL